MIVLQSVSVLCCLMSAALTDAVGTLTASSSLTSIMAGPTVTAHAQFAAGHRRSPVTAPAQWAAANMRLMDCTPPCHRLSYSSPSIRFLTAVCKCEAPIVHDSVPETARPVPRPCYSNSAVIVFHKHPQLLGPDTCVMTLHSVWEARYVSKDIQWALDMALEKMLVAGYIRSAMILGSDHSKDAVLLEILTAAGFQLQIERSSDDYLPKEMIETKEQPYLPKEVIWMKELPSAQADISAGASESTPMITVSGAVPHPDLPNMFLADTDSLAFGQERLEQICEESILIDLIDMKLKKFQTDLLSHALVKMDRTYEGSKGYKMAISALQELEFQPVLLNPKQKFNSADADFWLKKL